MSVLIDVLASGASEIGIELSEKQLKQFEKYYLMIVNTNKSLNLTSIVEEKDFAVKHFIDSLTCLKAVIFDNQMSLLDVGSGAGFPGIPIKICRPDLRVTLIDSLEKRVNFLNEAISGLDMDHIEAVHARVEDMGRNKDYREKYDRVVARAVANLGVLAEYCLPPLKVGGIFLAMKGPKLEEEIIKSQKAVTILGGVVESTLALHLPFSGDERNLVLIRKITLSPEKYPRRAGVPTKKPL